MKANEKEKSRDAGDSHKLPQSSLEPDPKTSLPLPFRGLGQNFLVDKRIIERFITSLHLRKDETIIEIGPGQGALTAPLLEGAGRLIAVEFDRNLIPVLADRFRSKKNFTLLQSDALVTEFCNVIRPDTQARVVANLPYNIATAILQRLIEQRRCLTEITLILQKELVDRITAPPGSRERGFLSVLVEAYCETQRLFDIAPRSSRPAPKVWSTVILLTFRPEGSVAISDEKIFWHVVSAGFAQRRKTILNNLRNAQTPLQEAIRNHGGASVVLSQAEVDLQRRAETLTLDEWVRIAKLLDEDTKSNHELN